MGESEVKDRLDRKSQEAEEDKGIRTRNRGQHEGRSKRRKNKRERRYQSITIYEARSS